MNIWRWLVAAAFLVSTVTMSRCSEMYFAIYLFSTFNDIMMLGIYDFYF